MGRVAGRLAITRCASGCHVGVIVAVGICWSGRCSTVVRASSIGCVSFLVVVFGDAATGGAGARRVVGDVVVVAGVGSRIRSAMGVGMV